MEYKKQIVQNVSSEIKSLFSQNINSLVDIAVNQKLEEEKYKFYEKLNICQEEFIETKEIGLFRHCGECDYCKKNYLIENEIASGSKTYLNNLIKNKIKESNLYDNEYLFICSCEPKNNAHSHYLISNYGRYINLHSNGQGLQINTNHKYDLILNREYFRILRSLVPQGYIRKHEYEFSYSFIMDIYQDYHPKATEIFTIEQKTLKLKNKE